MTGRLVGRQRELRSHAIAAARRVMDSCEAEFDWSAWNVDVYDPAGRCRMCVPFDDVGRKRDGRS